MKKLAIAGASLALAAMPVVGVFAADPADSDSFTDELTVKVAGGCTLETAGTTGDGTYANRTFNANIQAGTAQVLTGATVDQTTTAAPALTLKCNTTAASSTWKINATASTDNAQTPAAALVSGSDYIRGGNTFDGATSAWGMRLNAPATFTSTYNPQTADTFVAVPAAANTEVLSGNASQITSSGVEFNPSYKVYVAPNQATGDYVGSVVYTVVVTNS